MISITVITALATDMEVSDSMEVMEVLDTDIMEASADIMDMVIVVD